MRWYYPLAYLLGGAFLANALPHLMTGIAGGRFQSPFATPPGVGLSSAPVNVAWGLINLSVAYLLLMRVGELDLRRWSHVIPAAVGFGGAALLVARYFAALHGGGRLP